MIYYFKKSSNLYKIKNVCPSTVEFLAPLPVGNKSKKYIEGFLKAGPSIAVNRDYLGGFQIAQNNRKSKSKSTSVLSTPNDSRDLSVENRSRKSALSSAVSRKSESLNDDTLNEESSVVIGKLFMKTLMRLYIIYIYNILYKSHYRRSWTCER